MRRHAWRLLALGAIAVAALTTSAAPASADGSPGSTPNSCVSITPDSWQFDTCFFGVEVGARNNASTDFILRDGPTQDGACATVQLKVPGTTTWSAPLVTHCGDYAKTFNIPTWSSFFGKIDVRICSAYLCAAFQLSI